MKKLLLSLVACSAMLGATADDKELPNSEMVSEALSIYSAGAIVAATQIANTIVVWPVVSHIFTNQFGNDFLALAGGVSVGFLASVATEHLINLSVLKFSKQHGITILKTAREIINKYSIPVDIIGILAFFAAIAV